MLKVVLVFVGGGFGCVMRYGLGGWVQSAFGPTFPLGTLVVNVSGCLLIGFLSAIFTGPVLLREEYRVALLIGVLGGYTTFSSFGRETMALIDDGQFARASVNVVLSNGVGLFAVWLGARLAERWFGA